MKKASDSNLDFDGMAGNGVNRSANRFAGNQYSGVQNPNALVNKGRGPTKGNQDHAAMKVGAPATKDAYRAAPTSALPSVPAQGSVRDSINRGAQVRTPGGTRAWEPSAGQNYRGNPDKINVSGYSMGDGKVSKGSRPVAAGSTEGINYGPKKQY